MTSANLTWSAHPDAAEAIGEAVGEQLAGTSSAPSCAVLVVGPELAGSAGLLVRTAVRLLGADRTVGIVAPASRAPGDPAAVPTLALWAVTDPASPSDDGSLRVTFSTDEPDLDDRTSDLTVVLGCEHDPTTPALWDELGVVGGPSLHLDLPRDLVIETPTARGGRRRTALPSSPCAASTRGVEPLVLVTRRRGGAVGADGFAIRVDRLLLRGADGSGHRHLPASVALFPEPSEESA